MTVATAGARQDAALQRPERRRLRRGCRDRQLHWQTRVEQHEATRLTGSFAVHDDVAFIPAASWEETRALDPAYPCCTFRGSVTAVRVRDGSVVWKTYLVDPPQEDGPDRRRDADVRPVGRRHLVDAHGRRAPRLAVRHDRRQLLAPGQLRRAMPSSRSSSRPAVSSWSQQTTPNDIWNSSCSSRGANCPEDAGPDHDFGSSAMLVQDGERHGHPRRGPKIRRRVRVRSGQRRQTAVAGPRRQRRNQRRRPMGRPRATAATCMRPSRTSCACRT